MRFDERLGGRQPRRAPEPELPLRLLEGQGAAGAGLQVRGEGAEPDRRRRDGEDPRHDRPAGPQRGAGQRQREQHAVRSRQPDGDAERHGGPVPAALRERDRAESGGQRERLRVEHREHVGEREARQRDARPGRHRVVEQVLRDRHDGEQPGQAGEVREHQATRHRRDPDLVQAAEQQRQQREEAVLLGQLRQVRHLRHVQVAQPVPRHQRVPEVLGRVAHGRVARRDAAGRPLGGREVEDPRQGPRDDDRPDHLTPEPGVATCGRGRRRRRSARPPRGSRCT